jgi:hypothetical protein
MLLCGLKTYSGFFTLFACSIILGRLMIWYAHPLAFLKPAWHSDIFVSTTATSILRMMCVNTSPTEASLKKKDSKLVSSEH